MLRGIQHLDLVVWKWKQWLGNTYTYTSYEKTKSSFFKTFDTYISREHREGGRLGSAKKSKTPVF